MVINAPMALTVKLQPLLSRGGVFTNSGGAKCESLAPQNRKALGRLELISHGRQLEEIEN
jgi:hypothetical protein